MSQSIYGAWESQGEAVDEIAWLVANIHHIHTTEREGYKCLCGEKTITARQSTEHIMDVLLRGLYEEGLL